MRSLAITTWGLFCACSWTWCIGMYLPHLLLDRFGWPGFVVFAVVNVLGCSLFGYVVRTAARSRESVARHRSATRWFSVVTVAFHVFFVGFLATRFVADVPAWGPPAILIAAGLALSFANDRIWPGLAVITWGFSVAVFAGLGAEPLLELPDSGFLPATDLLFIGPVMAVGFFLCPYFDLTFHRALRRAGSPHAFAVFGATFAVMLLLTCVYWPLEPGAVPRMVVAHLIVQSMFTVGAHLRELRVSARERDTAAWPWLLAPLLAVPTIYAASTVETGQAMYLRFMVFYGLVFPAYALVFMGARGATLNRTNVVRFAVVLALLGPCFELAFIGGKAVWLAAPLVVAVGYGAIRCVARSSEARP